ncbi:MAG: hypothetical protein Q4D65_06975 [Peptostreptococcaceae bacterium]|nr:hypothetical protein [Peptostreptococcaceae bacterium]
MITILLILFATMLNFANFFLEKRALSIGAILLSLLAIYQIKKEMKGNSDEK